MWRARLLLIITTPHFGHCFLGLVPVYGPVGSASLHSGGGFIQYFLRCFLTYFGASALPAPRQTLFLPWNGWFVKLCISLKDISHLLHLKLFPFNWRVRLSYCARPDFD